MLYFGHFSTIPVGFRFAENFPLSIRYSTIYIYIYFPKILVTSVAIVFFEINCNVKNVVGIKRKNCGSRTEY